MFETYEITRVLATLDPVSRDFLEGLLQIVGDFRNLNVASFRKLRVGQEFDRR